MNSKAQTTIFVIMGVLILGVFGVMYYINNLSSGAINDKSASSMLLLTGPDEMENYIESCIREESKPLIRKLALNGGTLSENIYRKYNNISYSYLCILEPSSGCVNDIRTREFMENELRREILKKLSLCLDMQRFSEEGYKVEEGKMEFNAVIGSDTINLILKYPLKISKDSFNFERNEFSVIIKSNLGKLYDLALQILNSEIEEGSFDKDKWMEEHGALIGIDKHRPYPDTVYSLRSYSKDTGEELYLNFAIQGEDTVSRVDTPSFENHMAGYCYTERDNNCYANSAENQCLLRDGKWQQKKPDNCDGISQYGNGCEGGRCRDCGDRKHGETWCEYDGITGNGFDYVGSRHYLRSCYDGVLYYEECRDFREEMCVEDNLGASCRLNRWQDCALQYAKSDCEKQELRDCVWDDALGSRRSYAGYDTNRCYPEVPPGFRSWQRNGFKVCQMANEYNDCDGMGCPQDWIDYTAQYCYHMGDCGNYRNVADAISIGGYYNTNGEPSSFIYLPNGLNEKGQEYALNLDRDAKQEPLLNPDVYSNPRSNLNEIMRKISEFTEITTTWSKDDFIEQYIWEGEISYWTRHAAVCDVWQGISNGECWRCHEDKNKPCTEYLCKSLGSSCMYEESDGYGSCFNSFKNDYTVPVLEFDGSKLMSNFSYEADYFAGYTGWKISPGVYPHNLVKFGVKTNEDSQCKLSFLPGSNYSSIVWQAEGFSKEHEFRMRIPDTGQVIDYMKDTLQILSLLQMSKMEEITALFQKIKSDAQSTASEFGVDAGPFIQKMTAVEDNFNNNIKPQIKSFLDLTHNAIGNLMAELESRRLVFFIKCIDRAGNENRNEYIVKFDVLEDLEPPKLISSDNKAEGDNINMRFKINEEAECRYSFSDMEYKYMEGRIPCRTAYDDDNGFYYQCSKDILYTPQVYIQCEDKPPKLKKYAVHFIRDSSTKLLRADYPALIKINDSFINITNDFALLSNNTLIASSYPSMRLGILFDETVMCRYSNETKDSFDDYNEQIISCDKDYCEQEFEIYNRSIYIGCINGLNANRNINPESIVFEFGKD